MRLYTFTNMYLSPIQKGIQSAHLVHELFNKYESSYDERDTLYDWSTNHKTMIVLNGGYSETLSALNDLFCHTRNPYPFTTFHESKEALGGALTCVGIVLPEKIYELSAMIRKEREISNAIVHEIENNGYYVVDGDTKWNYTSLELKLALELNNYSLA